MMVNLWIIFFQSISGHSLIVLKDISGCSIRIIWFAVTNYIYARAMHGQIGQCFVQISDFLSAPSRIIGCNVLIKGEICLFNVLIFVLISVTLLIYLVLCLFIFV